MSSAVLISSSGSLGPLQEQKMVPVFRKALETVSFHQLLCLNSMTLRR